VLVIKLLLLIYASLTVRSSTTAIIQHQALVSTISNAY